VPLCATQNKPLSVTQTSWKENHFRGFFITSKEKKMKTNAQTKYSTLPVGAGLPLTRPEFLRLPKPRTLCPFSGLSRSKMNELVLPCAANGFKPPVRSISLRNRNQVKAVRLVVYDSLMAYLWSFLESSGESPDNTQ
jgi:hypothetical protein